MSRQLTALIEGQQQERQRIRERIAKLERYHEFYSGMDTDPDGDYLKRADVLRAIESEEP